MFKLSPTKSLMAPTDYRATQEQVGRSFIPYSFHLDDVNWACNDLLRLQLILSRVVCNPELSIGSSESDWLVSANEKASFLWLTNRKLGVSCVIMTHLAWVLSPAACLLSFDNKIFPNISCLNRVLTAGTKEVSVSLGTWPPLFSGNKSKTLKKL